MAEETKMYYILTKFLPFYRNFPELKWAQRKDRLFLTIELADVENHKIDLQPDGKLKF
jgi:hypothetical protein